MTRRQHRDCLLFYLENTARKATEAFNAYRAASNKLTAAREMGPALREAYSALELAECYRQLAALEVDSESLAAGRLLPAVPPEVKDR